MPNDKVTSTTDNRETKDAKLVDLAIKAFSKQEYSKAQSLLLSVIKHCPPDYQTQFKDKQGNLYIKFWHSSDHEHYLNCDHPEKNQQKISFYPSAYPKAYFYLALLEIKSENYQQALSYLELGATLEPNSPRYTIEKAHIWQLMGQSEKALETYQTIEGVDPYVTPKDYAIALEGQGNILEEMGDLMSALCMYQTSLQLNPNNSDLIDKIQSIKLEKAGEANNTPESAYNYSSSAQLTTETDISNVDQTPIVTSPSSHRKRLKRKARQRIYWGISVFILSGILYGYLSYFEQSKENTEQLNQIVTIFYRIGGKNIVSFIVAGFAGFLCYLGISDLTKINN
ncbi:MAG: hypothetical protein MK111_12910 [Crocosphaera sp.]|uniref:tetratricopeptide repeat protein n=1 Tax=Crocosphaera sp. TaxID=2729996 RepID=UPI002584BD3C|nr:hypothetical protein [Crocosphaera sp.]MCH2245523.1 hypothetical protein [Crocosphaera sp.]